MEKPHEQLTKPEVKTELGMRVTGDAGAILAALEVTCRAAWDAAIGARLRGRREALHAYIDVLTVAQEQMELLEQEFADHELQALDPYTLLLPFEFTAGADVLLLDDLPGYGLARGAPGTVMAKHDQAASQTFYEVEFAGPSLVVCSVTPHQLVPDDGQELG